jgi:NAD(P)H-flavin reductase
MNSIYVPQKAKIYEVIDETSDTKTFRFKLCDEKAHESFSFLPGQFCEFSVIGEGECTFCITSSPTRKEFLECSVKKVGKVTDVIHKLRAGDIIGFRGPYGNWFPVEELKGKNIIFVAGGIGLAPVRSLIQYVVDKRDDYGKVFILYGARSVSDLCYEKDLREWYKTRDSELVLTVDPGGETPDWSGKVGFVPTVLEQVNPSKVNAKVVTCGPPIMIKFTVQALERMGFAPKDVITTLEMKMKCGLGKCGRCNIGHVYVCKQGPVFTYAEIKEFPQEF